MDEVSTWVQGVQRQDDQRELGLATQLFKASKAAFAALLRALAEDSARTESRTSHYNVLRNEFQKFYMWNQGFSTTLGDLDLILACSKNLRSMVLALMVQWAKTICRIPKALPEYDMSTAHQQLAELEIVVEKVGIVAKAAANDIKTQYTGFDLHDSSEYDSDSDASSLMSDGSIEDILEDLKVYYESLQDLTPSLENPASIAEPARPFALIIRDRFPSTEPRLVKKLAEANWQRREELCEKLASAQAEGASFSSIDDDTTTIGKTVVDPSQRQAFLDQTPRASIVRSSFSLASIYQSVTTTSDYSNPSMFDRNSVQYRISRQAVTIAESVTSYATSIAERANDGQRRVPTLPSDHDFQESFQCKVCGNILRDVRNRSDWKKHVYNDLKPYICLSINCKLGIHTFQSQREWMNHEFEAHRTVTYWRCNLCGETYKAQELFRGHISTMHERDFMYSQIEEVIAASKRVAARDGSSETCPFCQTIPSQTQKGFASHVGRHLQEISLASLPSQDNPSDCSSDESDGTSGNDDDDLCMNIVEQEAPSKRVSSSKEMMQYSSKEAFSLENETKEEQLLPGSLYHACVNLRQRLAHVPGLDLDWADFDNNDKPNESQVSDPVISLWRFLRNGDPLLEIYNALLPKETFYIDKTTVPNHRQAKQAAFMFVHALIEHDSIPPGRYFTMSDLFGDDINGFTKVVETISMVLDEVERRGLILTSEAEAIKLQAGPQKIMSYRDQIVWELLSTERHYVQELQKLNDLRQTIELHGILQGDAISAIFLNLTAIFDFQQIFLVRLEIMFTKPPTKQEWGLIFVEFEVAFSIYEPFLANQRIAANVAEREFDQIAKTGHACVVDLTTFHNLLLRPLSRLTKYPSILEHLRDKTSADDRTKAELTAGIKSARRILHRAHEAIDQEARDEALTVLCDQVVDWKNHDVKQFGDLLFNGRFVIEIVDRVEREYQVYLFEWILICAKEVHPTVGSKGIISRLLRGRKENEKEGKLTEKEAAGYNTSKLQLKGRIFLKNVIEVAPVAGTKYKLRIGWNASSEGTKEYLIIQLNSHSTMTKWSEAIEKQRKILFPGLSGSRLPSSSSEKRIESDIGGISTRGLPPERTDSTSSKTNANTMARLTLGGITLSPEHTAQIAASSPPTTSLLGLRLRVHCLGIILPLVVGQDIRYQLLVDRIVFGLLQHRLKFEQGSVRLRYEDEDSDLVNISSDEDLRLAFEEWLEKHKAQRSDLPEMDLYCTI